MEHLYLSLNKHLCTFYQCGLVKLFELGEIGFISLYVEVVWEKIFPKVDNELHQSLHKLLRGGEYLCTLAYTRIIKLMRQFY